MKIVVQKFGGTSVSTKERRESVANKVISAINEGYSPIVVVSAMGRIGEPYATDTLLSLLDSNFKETNKQANDLLMCCGEIISSVVMSNELFNKGINAVPLTGGQAGIITDEVFSDARHKEVNANELLRLINEGKVPVVTGFQGVTDKGYFTTLGRGGSDTSAAIIGAGVNADRIEIYTDVDGIMTADPRIVKEASLIDVLSYSEVFQLADQGAKVVHPRAVDIAMKHNIPLLIKNTMNDCKGTLININGDINHPKIITGITYLNNRIQVRINEEENKNNPKYKDVLSLLASNNISLDLINIFPERQIFTIGSDKKEELISILETINIKYSLKENCSQIAIVGTRMTGIPGVIASTIKALNDKNIEVLQTADSNMTIWCLVNTKDVNEALNSLHKVFELS